MTLANGVTGQVGVLASFIHGLPVVVLYLAALGLFLVLAKSERLGGLSFRHVLFGFAYGLIGALVVLPASLQGDVSSLATPAKRNTAAIVFFAFIAIELFMIVRDRRQGGGGME